MKTHVELRDYLEGFDSLYEFRVEQATDTVTAGFARMAAIMPSVAEAAENLRATVEIIHAYGAWAAADNEDGAYEND